MVREAGRAPITAAIILWLGTIPAPWLPARAQAVAHPETAQAEGSGPLLGLLRRLRDDPPALGDSERMKGWVAPYGSATYDNDVSCQRGAMFMNPPTLPGVGMLSTTIRQSCTSGARHSTLLLTMEEAGSTLEKPAKALLTELFGPPDEACSDDVRTAWRVKADLTVTLISPFYPSFAIMVADVPVTDLDCTK